MTPDCHLVSLELKNGKERWRQTICDLDRYYYASAAPVIVGNHVIVGVSGDDLDIPGYVESHDPVTGALQWRWYVVPQKKGDPGLETWPNEEMAKHGGGMTWQPPTYDPELNLIYVTTGNPQPVVAYKNRPGANLFTASHRRAESRRREDAVVFPGVAARHARLGRDADAGAVRRRVQRASRASCWRRRRATASSSCSIAPTARRSCRPTTSSTNWSKGFDEKGQPIPDPAKDPQIDGALVTPNQGGATNWPPPSFSPKTGLFYVSAAQAYSVWYIYDAGDNPQGWGGTDRGGWQQNMLQAIDYKTGKVRWSHKWEGGGFSGLLSTAGNVLFSGDGSSGNFVALNATTGDPLWHAGVRTSVTNGPITYTLDGLQYVMVARGGYAVGVRDERVSGSLRLKAEAHQRYS